MDAERQTSLGRGLQLLLALGDATTRGRRGVGVVEVARLVGREKTQVSRALRTLAEHGFVDRDRDTLDYRLGWRLFALAARAGDQRLLAVAPPVLSELVERLGETAHISVLEGMDVLTVLSEAPSSAVSATEWSGRRAPAHCTSSGRALLFDHDLAALTARFGSGPLAPRGPRSPSDVGDLHQRLASARAMGCALTYEEFEAGLVAAAAPIRDFRGRIVAALNVSAPKFRFEKRLAVAGEEIKGAAGELSLRLGWVAEREPALVATDRKEP